MEKKIAPHYKDILQKYTTALFRDATLEYFGIQMAKVKEPINVELDDVDVAENRADFVFLLEDGSYAHFEFQSTFSKTVLPRFARYDTRLYDRDGRNITTIIIYTADVAKTEAKARLKIGSLTYEPVSIFMRDYNGNEIYTNLEAKLKSGEELTDTDMLNLIFLPLMKNSIEKVTLAEKTIEMANTIADETKRKLCKASAVSFAYAYLDNEKFQKVLEAIKMSGALAEFINEEYKIAIEKAVRNAEEKTAEKTAEKMILKSEPTDKIVEFTGLTEKKVDEIAKRLQK